MSPNPTITAEPWLTAYAMRGGPYQHDPKDRPRPDPRHRIGYHHMDPGDPSLAGLSQRHAHLGPPERPADEVMHRFWLELMEQLVRVSGVLGGLAHYPDASGLLLASVLLSRGANEPRLVWVGFDGRAAYAAQMLAIHALPDALVPIAARRREPRELAVLQSFPDSFAPIRGRR